MIRPLLPNLTLLLTLPLALLGACQSRDMASLAAPRYASLDAQFAAGHGTVARPLDRHAVAALPTWIGRPSKIQVAERPEGIAQRVTFASPGGTARLVAAWPAAGAASPDLPPKPTRDGIRDELAAALPGIVMEVVTRPARNAYGPYGLAIGRDGDARRCLYAWQWIEAPPALGFAGADQPLSLRLSLCRSDLTFDAMAAAVDRLRLVPAGQGEAVAAVPRPHRAKAQPVAAALASMAAPAIAPLPAPAPDPSGRRYLGADFEPAPRSALAAAAATVQGATAAPEPSARLAIDLPPEALRGPATDPSRPRP
ncbi:cellulose biosynthesis protein BcsN [Methylorubrum salsuginis]|uniref:Cellulose biosynthesis protein BcsN n=1 Tax=Methylorubrum salsuginis TaxID=414703 RepID=A0A1I4IQN4_9HYPH|nr:cellulose biosynthesis protein BcsN [Methylorubrum salsuginis]SFL56377.1 hypothetical protein SAMN04488125_1188 [Methylorubrum salsuginis]